MQVRGRYDGLAFDNVVFNNFQRLCGAYRWSNRSGVRSLQWHSFGYPHTPTTNARIQSDLLSYFRYMATGLRRAYPEKSLTANTNLVATGIPISALTSLFDGFLDERGFTGFGRGWLSDAAWEQEVQGAEDIAEAGRALILVAYAKPAGSSELTHLDVQRTVNWVLANYLIVRGGNTYTYVDRLASSYVDLAQYHIPIGRPTSRRYKAQGLQWRDYSAGLVLVNPSSTTPRTANLDGRFTDAFGVVRNQITLGPMNGAILVSKN